MIVPVIYSLNPVADNKMYTWVFIKAVSFVKRYRWPVIAQKQYFDNIDNMEGFFSENLIEHFEYDSICRADFEKIIPIEIPKKIEKEYISRFPSQTDAFISSVKEPWNEMETFLDNQIQKLEDETGEKIEAFITLPNNRFLEDLANKRNIPIIHFEWGPFRPKAYRKTAYFDFSNIIIGLRQRYEEFIRRGLDKNVPILSRQEILSLFLEKEYLQYCMIDKIPSYEMGVATGYTTIGEYSAYNMVSVTEMNTMVKEYFNESNICWRMHPEDPQHAQINAKNYSSHDSAMEFILDCKRVLSSNSNMAYEAMLFDRISYDVGFSHYSFQGNDTLVGVKDNKPDIRFLNFVAFAYLIPYELLDNVDYIRYRLSNPSEDDIYNYHVNYYLNVLELKRNVLEQENRISIILQKRGFLDKREDILEYQTGNICMQGKVSDDVRCQRLKNELQEVKIELQKTRENQNQYLQKIQELDAIKVLLNQENNYIIQLKQVIEQLTCNCIKIDKISNERLEIENRDIKSQHQKDIEEQIIAVKEIYENDCRMQVAILYLDMGDGFNEENKLYAPYEIHGQEYKAEFEIPDDVKIIRFDPCECGQRMLYYTELLINGMKDEYEQVNVCVMDGKNTFIEKNPYFILKNVSKKICISIEIHSL